MTSRGQDLGITSQQNNDSFSSTVRHNSTRVCGFITCQRVAPLSAGTIWKDAWNSCVNPALDNNLPYFLIHLLLNSPLNYDALHFKCSATIDFSVLPWGILGLQVGSHDAVHSASKFLCSELQQCCVYAYGHYGARTLCQTLLWHSLHFGCGGDVTTAVHTFRRAQHPIVLIIFSVICGRDLGRREGFSIDLKGNSPKLSTSENLQATSCNLAWDLMCNSNVQFCSSHTGRICMCTFAAQ